MLLLCSACSVSDLVLNGRECPCVDGWVCDDTRNLCVPSGEDAEVNPADGGGGVDGGRDGGPTHPDSGVDAGPFDGGPGADPDAGRDAGSDGGLDGGTDAGPPDAGPDPSSCDDVHSGALFCEDFEGSLAAWEERIATSSGSVSIDGEEVYRGRGALRVRTASGLQEAYARADVLPEMTSGDLYVRSYYFFPNTFSLSSLEFAALADTRRNHHLIATLEPSDYDIHTHGFPTNLRDRTGMRFPRGEWVCVEQHVRFHDAAGVVELSVEGIVRASITGIDTVEPGGLTVIEAGIPWQSDGQAAATAYVDEIVADTSPIGCD